MSRRNSGSLVLAGIGYQTAGHVTSEVLTLMRSVDRLFFLVYDPLHERWLRRVNPRSVSLAKTMKEGRALADGCHEMALRILNPVRRGLNVCAVFSGHPTIAVDPAHEALRLARLDGLRAKMLPAVSGMDCLFADLGVDPAGGCQFFDAEALLEKRFRLDPQSCLVLFQAGVIGVRRHRLRQEPSRAALLSLTKRLLKYYDSQREVVIYEAAMLPVGRSRIERIPLAALPKAKLSPISTLYIPPDGA